MFARKPNPEIAELNLAISNALAHLNGFTPDSEEYAATADQLVKLYAQKKEIPSNRVSKDQLLAVSGNLLGILVIVGYESRNALTTKALGFLGKATR